MPLGKLFSGRCLAAVDAKVDRRHESVYCNRGYARGHCEHLPAESADAHRFSFSGLKLTWIVERDHRPEQFGVSTYFDGRFDPALPERIDAQAKAFVTVFLSSHPA